MSSITYKWPLCALCMLRIGALYSLYLILIDLSFSPRTSAFSKKESSRQKFFIHIKQHSQDGFGREHIMSVVRSHTPSSSSAKIPGKVQDIDEDSIVEIFPWLENCSSRRSRRDLHDFRIETPDSTGTRHEQL